MPLYESTFITRQELSRQDITKLTENIGAIVAQGGGKVVKDEYWGLRSLAYKIQKSRRGHYVMLSIDAPAPAVKEMERNLRHNEDVVRLFTVRVDALEEGSSIMMQQSRVREDGVADDVVISAQASEVDASETIVN
jgi:small subunit ribosomal protein S6